MTRALPRLATGVLALTCLLGLASAPEQQAEEASTPARAAQWPEWRGPLATGVAPRADPPIEWSEDKNLQWKSEIPGEGHSTPVVWNDQIFLTAAIPTGEPFPPRHDRAPGVHDSRPIDHAYQFVVLSVARTTGKIRWQTPVKTEIPHEGGHYTASLASNSPVTDGQAVYAFFGSRGLHALDMEGKILWQRDFGEMQTKHAHGEGASPALAGETLVVNWDHRGQSFVAAIDTKTGKDRWRRNRDEVTSWATPIMVEEGGRTQVVVSGTERVRAYDLETGEVVWECGGLSANVVASPVAGDGMLFAASSYDTRALLAIRLAGAKGDLTGTEAIVWSRTRGTPYVPSPLLYQGGLYFLRHYQPILTRLDAATGVEQPGPIRLGGLRDIYASPIAAAGRVYVTDRHGRTLVVSAGPEPELLADNQLDDRFNASAVAVGKQLLLRGEKSLYSLRIPD